MSSGAHTQKRQTYAVLLLGLIWTACYCYFVSRDRILWSDELFAWMVVTDPSWHHMLQAWRDGADGGGIFFYLSCRTWLHVFGQTVLSFRAFSAAGCFAAYCALWLVLRRFYSTAISLFALWMMWLGSETILWQIVQTRFYGVLLGAVAWLLYFSVRSAAEADEGMPARVSTLVWTTVLSLVAVNTHPFGVVYLGAIVAGAAAADMLAGRKRPLFYLCALLPVGSLIFAREAIANSGKVGKPWFWTVRPRLAELRQVYTPGLLIGNAGRLLRVFVPLLMLALLALRLVVKGVRRSAEKQRRTVLFPGVFLACMPIVFWLKSQQGTSYFVERYLIPFTLGVAILSAEAAWTAFQLFEARPLARRALTAVSVLLLLSALAGALGYPGTLWVPPRDFTGSLAAQLPRDVPVVIERIDLFDMMQHQQSGKGLNMLYVLDWASAVAPGGDRGAVSSYHEMENWKREGYYAQSIVYSSEFLRTTDRFVMLQGNEPAWFTHLRSEPGWKIEKLGDYNNPGWPGTFWSAQRK